MLDAYFQETNMEANDTAAWPRVTKRAMLCNICELHEVISEFSYAYVSHNYKTALFSSLEKWKYETGGMCYFRQFGKSKL